MSGSGKGATLKTLIKTLRALDRADWLLSLAPLVSISPLQMLKARCRRVSVSCNSVRVGQTMLGTVLFSAMLKPMPTIPRANGPGSIFWR
ncbi:MAG: hypothetical protein A2505_01940 [Deltaproteobacteria bacterium RIFOXYD12_FULL_55_16]|nr:MAG: hypothetical protein A2505_01940 [Deltaproteobacteria bacterium RIFOXYD12_FULL_55_16]